MSHSGDAGLPAGGYGAPSGPYGGFPVAPAYGSAPEPVRAMPPNKNIGWAIAALLLFWPLAIPSFIAALKVSDLWFTGRYDEAVRAAADAKKWGVAGVVVGGAWIGIVVVVYAVLIVSMITGGSTLSG